MVNALVLIGLLTASLFSFFSLDANVSVSAQKYSTLEAYKPAEASHSQISKLEFPIKETVSLDFDQAEHVRLYLKQYGASIVGILRLKVTGPGVWLVEDKGQAGPLQQKCLKPKGKRSKRITGDTSLNGEEIWRCDFVFRTGKRTNNEYILSAMKNDVIIHDAQFEIASSKRHSSASPSLLFGGFIVLLLIGPLFVWLRRFGDADKYLLAGLGLVWLSFTGMTSLLMGLGFVSTGYAAVQVIRKTGNKNQRLYLTILMGIILFLLFVKFLAPVMAEAFANPGGFWLALPLGISYFAIKLVDLMMTAYSGTLKSFRALDYLAFMLLPHTIAAGPILTFDQFANFRNRDYNMQDFAAGTARVLVGFSKKALADIVFLPYVISSVDQVIVDKWQAQPELLLTMLMANLVYVYLDFSAYCDIAIGTGRAAGLKIPENFDWPLSRSGIRSYWRHWHISLSGWVMRRVYFPAFLASRSPTMSLVASMLVIGLWHVPNLSWSAWAIHHGMAMAAEGRLMGNVHHNSPWNMPEFKIFSMRSLRYLGGVLFIWFWVSLGHSFTLFSNFEFALAVYLKALFSPVLIWL